MYIPALVLSNGMHKELNMFSPLELLLPHVLIWVLDAIAWLYALLASLWPFSPGLERLEVSTSQTTKTTNL